jgi:hypothetical protein
LHFFLFGSDADFFLISDFQRRKVHGCLCAPEGAVDAVLLGFQLLWELVYLKTLVERLLSIASKGERTRQHFFVRKNGFA